MLMITILRDWTSNDLFESWKEFLNWAFFINVIFVQTFDVFISPLIKWYKWMKKKETEEKKVENWVRMKLLIFYNEINIDVKLFLFHYHGNFSFFAGCRRTFLKRKRWMRLTPNKYTA